MDESNNIHVSSRGILKSCDYFSITPHSSVRQLLNYPPLHTIRNNSCPLIYICSSALPHFCNIMLPHIKSNFILVSGDCDLTMPNDVFNEKQVELFLNHPLLIHWFCQNMVMKHDKITCIPIGLDYHTMTTRKIWGNITSPRDQEHILNSIKSKCAPFSQRTVKCYANFHFTLKTRYAGDRMNALTEVPKELVFYQPKPVNRMDTWKKQMEYAFVISPHGGGYDCHRTWEALVLGCIPIVKTSKIDILYDDLPVLIVNDWKDVNVELLENTIAKFSNMEFRYERLTLSYWMQKIRQHRVF